MSELNNEEIIDFYDNHESIWPENDNWHRYTKEQLIKYVNKYVDQMNFNNDLKILNAGSGGSTYNLKQEMHHLDLTDKHISQYENYTVASVESTPFENEAFNAVICVGSVLNYCNATTCINELSRVLSPKGYLILEFESSWSMEFYKTPVHKKGVSIASTTYFDTEHKLWMYSNNYIKKILEQNKLDVITSKRFHILSSFVYRRYHNENKAALYTKFDSFARWIPFFSNRSHNIILLCQKN